jgi:hypothetical protein
VSHGVVFHHGDTEGTETKVVNSTPHGPLSVPSVSLW